MRSPTCGNIFLSFCCKSDKKLSNTIAPESKMAEEYEILGEDVKTFVRQRTNSFHSQGSSKSSLDESVSHRSAPQPPRKRVPLALTLSQWDSFDHTCKPVHSEYYSTE